MSSIGQEHVLKETMRCGIQAKEILKRLVSIFRTQTGIRLVRSVVIVGLDRRQVVLREKVRARRSQYSIQNTIQKQGSKTQNTVIQRSKNPESSEVRQDRKHISQNPKIHNPNPESEDNQVKQNTHNIREGQRQNQG